MCVCAVFLDHVWLICGVSDPEFASDGPMMRVGSIAVWSCQTDKRWSTVILDWKPNGGKGRHRGRPKTRWEDEIVAIAGGNWIEIAADEEAWGFLKHGFVCGVV